jgi:hypothetical protein
MKVDQLGYSDVATEKAGVPVGVSMVLLGGVVLPDVADTASPGVVDFGLVSPPHPAINMMAEASNAKFAIFILESPDWV